MLYATIEVLGWNPEAQFFYPQQPLRYEIKVSADGQILGYKALDSFTVKQLGQSFPRPRIDETTRLDNKQNPKSPSNQSPVTTFEIEFRGLDAFKITHPIDRRQ